MWEERVMQWQRPHQAIPISRPSQAKLTFNIEQILLRVGANFNIYVVKWGLEKLVWKSRIPYTLSHWLYLKTSILLMNSQILKHRFEWFSLLRSRDEEPCQLCFRRIYQAATLSLTNFHYLTFVWRKSSVNEVCLKHWPARCHGTPSTWLGVLTVSGLQICSLRVFYLLMTCLKFSSISCFIPWARELWMVRELFHFCT